MRIHSYLELPWAIPEAEAAPFEEAMVDNGLLRSKQKWCLARARRSEMRRPEKNVSKAKNNLDNVLPG